MHRSLLSVVLSVSVLLSTLVAAHAASYAFTTFDVPDASRTLAYDIMDFSTSMACSPRYQMFRPPCL